ncbi:MAG: DNA cytosine methyltransferase [Syntrophobacteraceae bacterium]
MGNSFSVIDLFAGPGGLGEGFAAFENKDGTRPFSIRLAVEKDIYAHSTLLLRCFFRQFAPDLVPDEYYQYLQSKISRAELFNKFPKEAESAAEVALLKELGKNNATVYRHISKALGEEDDSFWVMTGGPPCQLYSVVGRSRLTAKRNNDIQEYEDDRRHTLYKDYLRCVAKFRPPIFVMENVTGILSATHKGKSVINKIIKDLQFPAAAVNVHTKQGIPYEKRTYCLYSLVKQTTAGGLEPSDFIIKAENYGVPQSRHRLIILGVRKDLNITPGILRKADDPVSVEEVLSDLPKIRSLLSREPDSYQAWIKVVRSSIQQSWLGDVQGNGFRQECLAAIKNLSDQLGTGGQFLEHKFDLDYSMKWFGDKRLGGVCNHSARAHIRQDLHRYFFASCFARAEKRSPKICDFPKALWPKHDNIEEAVKGKFDDRFRVQVACRPATTVTCHLAKDGHYYIHYDPSQCRSLTVREAARLQTFPDNYFFEGQRTHQYIQVGNAVPPLLAKQIAEIVYKLLAEVQNG